MKGLVAKVCVVVALAVLLGLLAAVGSAATAPAGLDPSYGDGGVASATPVVGAGQPPGSLFVQSFGPDADGSVYAIGGFYGCTAGVCGPTEALERYDADGAGDKAFGGGGNVPLSAASRRSVIADGGGRALVAGVVDKTLEIRAYTAAGVPATNFGSGGLLRLPCDCNLGQVRLIAQAGGGAIADVSGPDRSRHSGNVFRLTRLRANGTVDRSYGTDGTARLTIPGPGEPHAVVATPGGGILIGGSGPSECCAARRVFLWRVSAKGRADRRFDATAARSLQRLSVWRFKNLVAVVPREDGTIALVGPAGQPGNGFYLRLRSDGRLAAGFGTDGLARLPFSVEAAIAGMDGALFAVGQSTADPYGAWRAFRVLADGRPDPTYGGKGGTRIPLIGVRIGLASLGGGRVLVTDNGNSFCRSACVPDPAMARFRE